MIRRLEESATDQDCVGQRPGTYRGSSMGPLVARRFLSLATKNCREKNVANADWHCAKSRSGLARTNELPGAYIRGDVVANPRAGTGRRDWLLGTARGLSTRRKPPPRRLAAAEMRTEPDGGQVTDVPTRSPEPLRIPNNEYVRIGYSEIRQIRFDNSAKSERARAPTPFGYSEPQGWQRLVIPSRAMARRFEGSRETKGYVAT